MTPASDLPLLEADLPARVADFLDLVVDLIHPGYQITHAPFMWMKARSRGEIGLPLI
jgi:hypothetical protein